MKTKLKTKLSVAIIAILSILFFDSCKKENIDNSRSLGDLNHDALLDILQTTTFNAEDGITFVSDSGAILEIAPNSLELDGAPVTGVCDLEFTEIYDAGTMAACDKPTMGRLLLPSVHKSLLISGGEFEINVKKGGRLLSLTAPMEITVPSYLTDSAHNEMDLFKGTTDSDQDGHGDGLFVWDLVDGTANNQRVKIVDRLNPKNSQYEPYYNAFVEEFGWTNIDRFYSDPRPKTTMQVKAPVGFDFDNCAIYLKYKGEASGLARLDTYDESTKLFSEHYGQIPIGLECYLIFCAVNPNNSNEWQFSSKEITITANTTFDVAMPLQTGDKKTYVGHVTLMK